MSEPTWPWRLWHYDGHGLSARDDRLLEEAPLRVRCRGVEPVSLMATPGEERELAAGLAVTMGWSSPANAPPKVTWDGQAREAVLELEVAGGAGPLMKSAGGGPVGPPPDQPGAPPYKMELEALSRLTGQMQARQRLFEVTGASHAAAVFDEAARLICLAEDVGRHNAVDKAIGALWLAGRLQDARVIAFSGRQSVEMVLKAARARIPVLIGVSAPTAEAVRTAQGLGLTLAGFARDERLNLYTHPERLGHQGRALNQP